MEYTIRLDPLVRRQIIGWKLSDSLLVDVYLRLKEDLGRSPTSALSIDPSWFDAQGMVYGFELIDPEQRMLVHSFHFQVFYDADEQTLLIACAAHITAEGI